MNSSIISLRFDEELFTSMTSEYRSAIMGLSMLSIMLYHQYITSVVPFNFFHNFGYWGVDVFLFLSGAGLVYSLKKNTIRIYYLRRFLRLLPSCIFCGTIRFLLILLLGSFSLLLKERLNYSAWTLASMDLWFIHTIIILYAISPLLYTILKKWPLFTFTIIITSFFYNGIFIKPIVGYEWLSPIGVFSWTMERTLVFSIGMYTSINKDKINIRLFFSVLFLLMAICLVFVDKTGRSFRCIQACIYFALALGMPALLCLFVYILKIIPSSLLRLLIFIGTYSLELYLVHEFLFWTLKNAFINGNPWILLPLGFILSFLFAYLCKLCISKLKFSNLLY